ncbi:MAG: TOBE domain-containing protein, partial [Ramlibacter sp.]
PPMNLMKNAPGGRPGSIMGIRPEHLDIGNEGWEATVVTCELLGAERLVYATVGGEQLIVRTEEHDAAPSAGSTIRITPRQDRVHWFNVDTGKRL